MTDLIKASFRSLGRKHLRTILTILGISIGVASVVIIANISQSGTDSINSEMDSLGLCGLTVSASDEGNAVLDQEDLSLIKHTQKVLQASPVIMQSSHAYVRNLDTKVILWGIDSNAGDIISLQAVYGRLLTQQDISTQANVCLVDEAFSESAYSRANIIGKKISILCGTSRQYFTVVGVIKTGTGLLQSLIEDYVPTFIYTPYTTLQVALQKNDFDEVAVKITNGSNAETIGEDITERLNSYNGTQDAFVSTDLAKQKDGLLKILGIITLILSAVGAVSLLVASLSIMTMMLVSVNERTREIGIKKALGATSGEIMLEFLFEAILITLIGSFIGMAGGCLVSFAGAAYFQTSLSIRPDIMLMTAGFALLSGIIFGVYPAYKAACMKPVEALRQE